MRSFFSRTFPLWAGAGLYLLFSLYLFSGVQIPDVPAERNGPILFWQDGAIYTIRADGTGLTRVTPALMADRRFTEVSPACHGLVNAPCWVLIGHVLYSASGQSRPLPLLPRTEWLNAFAAWSPDGTHLAYMLETQPDGERMLVVYDITLNLLWRVAEGVDETRRPAWSAGCADGLADDCYLAFARLPRRGQRRPQVEAIHLRSGQVTAWPLQSAWGHLLRWSADDRLYVGGRLGWVAVATGQPLNADFGPEFAQSPAPTVDYVAYSGLLSRTEDMQTGVWLAKPGQASPRLLYAFSSRAEAARFTQDLLWSPRGDALAAFSQGQLVHFDLSSGQVSIWYQTASVDVLKGYAFAPLGDALALVAAQYADTPENPPHRLFVVDASGQVTILRAQSRTPILLLAWLPGDYQRHLLPRHPADAS